MKHWAAHLVGKPYKAGASGPDEFDCIGLVRYYFKEHLGVVLPDYQVVGGTSAELGAFIKATAWHKVSGEARDSDVMTMQNYIGRHVGVVVRSSEGLGLLHAQGNDQSGSVIWQPLSTLTMYQKREVWRAQC